MKEMKPGDVFKVSNGFHYELPKGLQAGDTVKLLAFDHGYWTVEKDGRQFKVFLARIESGLEYELNGKWLPEDDWRVKAIRGLNSQLLSEEAMADVEGAIVYPFSG